MHELKPIRFLLGDRIHTVEHCAPTRTVLEYLREDLECTGTKEGCAEGDCGACTVMIGELDGNGSVSYRTVNSCIQFVPSLDGRQVVTVEHLKSPGGALHPAQQAMVECHASQCGFCTPGFVMSMAALHQQKNGAAVTREEAVQALSGNLCRCTGYRPILEAALMMAHLPAQEGPAALDATTVVPKLESLQRHDDAAFGTAPGAPVFLAPRTADELAQLLLQKPETRLIAGCTDIGLWVTKQFRPLADLAYTGHVAELAALSTQDDVLSIGAAVSLTDAFAALERHYPQLDDYFQRFASVPVRNAGTVGGNVANGSPIGDSMPLLIALGARLVLQHGSDVRRIVIEDFYLGYQKTALQQGEFLRAIEVPLLPAEHAVRAYKVSKRFDDDITITCMVFNLTLDQGRVNDIRIGVGGMAAVPKRAVASEAALRGNAWNINTIDAAIAVLKQEFQPLTDMRGSAQYRSTLSGNLLKRFYLETTSGIATSIRGLTP